MRVTNIDYYAKVDVALYHLKLSSANDPVSARTLGNIAGFDTRRSTSGVRAFVRKMVNDGHPILSSNKGYWYANTHKELQEDMNRRQAVQAAYSGRIQDEWVAFTNMHRRGV